jgi:hypothetical protein
VARRLRRLDLYGNYTLQLTAAGVDAAAKLRSLTLLNLQRQRYDARDDHPEELLARLRAALPGCDVLA